MLLSRRARRLVAASVVSVATACGGRQDPVRWTASLDGPASVAPGGEARVVVSASPERGWYFYSLTQPAGGPTPARIWLADSASFGSAGRVTGPEPSRSFDKTFSMNVEKHSSAASFIVPVRARPDARTGTATILVSALFQACNDTICLSPRTVTLAVPVKIQPR
ncbi:MAG TPA: protein-disulfide reductase DsbD domain-containing protein [Gemmatimonadaceae bacterium]|nr:protein-disulfide reductase DsbD domain-containing protein [Gemmatimonadaceae bacterium]